MKKLFGFGLMDLQLFYHSFESCYYGRSCLCRDRFLYGIYTVIKKFVNPAVPMGFSSTMSAIVFIEVC